MQVFWGDWVHAPILKEPLPLRLGAALKIKARYACFFCYGLCMKCFAPIVKLLPCALLLLISCQYVAQMMEESRLDAQGRVIGSMSLTQGIAAAEKADYYRRSTNRIHQPTYMMPQALLTRFKAIPAMQRSEEKEK